MSTDNINVTVTTIDPINVTVTTTDPINITVTSVDIISSDVLTVKEVDGTPTVANVKVLEIDQSTGLNLKDIGSNTVRVDASGVLQSQLIQEEPVQLTTRRYQTINSYRSGSLKVFLNGLKEKYIIEISSNTFDFEIDTIPTDTVEIEYIKDSL